MMMRWVAIKYFFSRNVQITRNNNQQKIGPKIITSNVKADVGNLQIFCFYSSSFLCIMKGKHQTLTMRFIYLHLDDTLRRPILFWITKKNILLIWSKSKDQLTFTRSYPGCDSANSIVCIDFKGTNSYLYTKVKSVCISVVRNDKLNSQFFRHSNVVHTD